MADSVLTDAELRDELKRVGFDPGPVTASTRSLYVRKLNALKSGKKIVAKKGKNKPVSKRPLIGFSSDESDEEEAKSNWRKGRSRPSVSTQVNDNGVGSLRKRGLKHAQRNNSNVKDSVHEDEVSSSLKSFQLHEARPSPAISRDKLPTPRNRRSLGNNFLQPVISTTRRSGRRSLQVVGSLLSTSSHSNATGSKEEDFSDSDVDEKKDTNGEDESASVSRSNIFSRTFLRTSPTMKNKQPEEDTEISRPSSTLLSITTKSSTQSPPRASTPVKPNNINRSSHFENPDNYKPNNTSASSEYVSLLSGTRTRPLRRRSTKDREANHIGIAGTGNINKVEVDEYIHSRPSSSAHQLETEFQTEENITTTWGTKYGHYVSMMLLAFVFLFFVTLTVVYLSMGTDNETPNSFTVSGNPITYCWVHLLETVIRSIGEPVTNLLPVCLLTLDKAAVIPNRMTGLLAKANRLAVACRSDVEVLEKMHVPAKQLYPYSSSFIGEECNIIEYNEAILNDEEIGTSSCADLKAVLQICKHPDPLCGFMGNHIVEMVHILHKGLGHVAGNYLCGTGVGEFTQQYNMSLNDARRYLERELKKIPEGTSFLVALQHFEDMLKNIILHPEWGIRAYDTDRPLGHVTEEFSVDNVTWLESTHPIMPLKCRVLRSIYYVFLRLFLLGSVVFLAWSVYVYVKYRQMREEEELGQMYQLVDRIIEFLQTNGDKCQAIPHVRDRLIPPSERKERQRVWERAVRYINSEESRVRVETQSIVGEVFSTWRWLQPQSTISFPPMTETDMKPGKIKVWQGQAFENLDTAVKTAPGIYTQFLKIRNMFDQSLESNSNEWHVEIEDAILDKVGDGVKILHIAVDKNSREGCVYAKVETPVQASYAYRALQGSWFDGRLVTVKYLKPDRYYYRFPSARDMATPLLPSTSKKQSLSSMDFSRPTIEST